MPLSNAAVAKYILLARVEFTLGTGFATPEEVVAHGSKPVEEWCRVLADHRSSAKTGFQDNVRVPAWERGLQEVA
jgi:hypothetical protein